ncbi:MAG TPA: S9 family peptidase [Candidatus Eisenbacteria bacterium]
MPALAWLTAMTILSADVVPIEKLQSRPRPDVRRYSIEQLFATRTIGEATWSPDGERIACVTNISGRNNLWLVPATGGWPVQLTVSEQREAGPAWSPDGKWIAFQSDHDADEQWDLMLVSPRSGEVQNLTNTPKVSEERPLWSPDSKWIALTVKPQSAPNHELALWDVNAGRMHPLTKGTPPDWSYEPVAFVPGGRWLLAARTHASGKDADAVLVDRANGTVRNLTAHQGEQRWEPADVSADGRWVLVTSDAKNGFANVALLDLKAALERTGPDAGPAPVTWVTQEKAEAAGANFSPDGRWLTYRVNVEGNGELWSYSPASQRRNRLPLPAGFNSAAGNPSCYSPDGTRLLVRRSAATSPGDLFAYDLNAATTRPITRAFVAGVEPADMVEPALVHYPSRDNVTVSAFLYLPWNLRRDHSHAAIVWVHGGPTAQSVNGFDRTIQYFVNRGFVVLAPNYRGSTGYGKAFVDANRFDMGGGDLADVVAGAAFLEKTGFVNAKKIAVGGGSYGGYLTMMAVTKSPGTWAAGVALFPFVNWFTEVEHEDPLLRQYDLATMGDPKKNATLYHDRSPVFFVDRIRAPLLLVAGGNDPRCPPEESQQVVNELKSRGRTCEFMLYRDEGHGFARRENAFDAYRRIVTFLERELKGAKR